MINKIAIAALSAAVMGLGASHSGLSQPLPPPAAQAVDEVTGIEIITGGGSPTDFTFVSAGGTLDSGAFHTPVPGLLPVSATPGQPLSVLWGAQASQGASRRRQSRRPRSPHLFQPLLVRRDRRLSTRATPSPPLAEAHPWISTPSPRFRVAAATPARSNRLFLTLA